MRLLDNIVKQYEDVARKQLELLQQMVNIENELLKEFNQIENFTFNNGLTIEKGKAYPAKNLESLAFIENIKGTNRYRIISAPLRDITVTAILEYNKDKDQYTVYNIIVNDIELARNYMNRKGRKTMESLEHYLKVISKNN